MNALRRATRADIAGLPAGARRAAGRLFSLTYAPLPWQEGVRLSCTVSKKVARLATARNTLKRRARAAARDALRAHSISAIFLFQAKPAAGRAGFPEITADIQKLVAGAVAHLA